MPPVSLRLADFTDEEVLALVLDLANYEGWTSSADFSESVGLPISNVGTRLSWLKRYGVLERDTRPGSPTRGMWRLTNRGVKIVEAKFSASQRRAFEALSNDQLWLATRAISLSYEQTDTTTANLVRRRFTASSLRRKSSGY